jgi:hypothetical protein
MAPFSVLDRTALSPPLYLVVLTLPGPESAERLDRITKRFAGLVLINLDMHQGKNGKKRLIPGILFLGLCKEAEACLLS